MIKEWTRPPLVPRLRWTSSRRSAGAAEPSRRNPHHRRILPRRWQPQRILTPVWRSSVVRLPPWHCWPSCSLRAGLQRGRMSSPSLGQHLRRQAARRWLPRWFRRQSLLSPPQTLPYPPRLPSRLHTLPSPPRLPNPPPPNPSSSVYAGSVYHQDDFCLEFTWALSSEFGNKTREDVFSIALHSTLSRVRTRRLNICGRHGRRGEKRPEVDSLPQSRAVCVCYAV
mmetsp:Transcript_18012/g.36663  ORF Transcript_18012/g.36663 Transcript_18012/m.36663 type:complete len:225 (-) Transcript_18012:136-810(-)